MTRSLSELRPVPRRGLSRDESAMYIGVSAGKFDEMVAAGRMPGPGRADGRRDGELRCVELAFDALPKQNHCARNRWDGVRGHGHDADQAEIRQRIPRPTWQSSLVLPAAPRPFYPPARLARLHRVYGCLSSCARGGFASAAIPKTRDRRLARCGRCWISAVS